MNRIVCYNFSWITRRHLVWALFSVAGLCTLEVKHHAASCYSAPSPGSSPGLRILLSDSSTEADAHPASPCSTSRERLVDSLMWQWHLQLWNSVPMGVWKHKPAERGSWMIQGGSEVNTTIQSHRDIRWKMVVSKKSFASSCGSSGLLGEGPAGSAFKHLCM